VPEDTTAYAGFLSGKIDVMDSAPSSEVQSMLKNGTAVAIPVSGTSFININVGPKATAQVKKVLGNKDVRQALSLAINKVALCTAVLKGGQKPAVGFVPYGQLGPNGKEFRDHKTYFDANGNVAQAKALLAKAGYPDGKGFPNFQYYYYTSQTNDAIAQTIQDMWKNNLGINVTLVNREKVVFNQDMVNGNYAIAMGGDTEVPEYPKILQEVLETKADYNTSGYSNPKFDAIIEKAQSQSDAQKSFNTYIQAEDIIMNDMPVIPLYFSNTLLIQQKKVTGVFRDNTSMIYFEKADKN
jgi:oligopeptide transport system substrate-binding protein